MIEPPITEEGVKKLTQEEFAGITPEQISQFNPSQLKGMKAINQAWISTEQQSAFNARSDYFVNKSAKRTHAVEKARGERATTVGEVRAIFKTAHDTALGQLIKASFDNAKLVPAPKGVVKVASDTSEAIKTSSKEVAKIAVADYLYPRPKEAGVGIPVDLSLRDQMEVMSINRRIKSEFAEMGAEVTKEVEILLEKHIAIEISSMALKSIETLANSPATLANNRQLLDDAIINHTMVIAEGVHYKYDFDKLKDSNPELHDKYEKSIKHLCTSYPLHGKSGGVQR
jgi:hypothetical protein